MDSPHRRASPCFCPATMRKRRSPRPSPASAQRCPARPSTSTTTTAATGPARSPREAGAVVRSERQQGKGHVVRRMFADIDADVYVMADGDLTYDPKSAPAMVDLLLAEQLDMVVGTRRHEEKDAYRGGHVLGNRLFTGLLVAPVRAQLHRHLLGLPSILAPLRQELPGALLGLRDRDRDERPCARAADAGGRGRDRLCGAARRLGVEALDLFATAGGS